MSARSRRRGAPRRRGQRSRRNAFSGVLPSPWASMNLPRVITRQTLRGDIQLNTNGSGILAEVLPTDPSSGTYSFPDWTHVANLFGGIRVVKMEVKMCITFDDDTKAGATPIFAGFNFTSTSTPASASQVSDQPGSKMLTPKSTTNGITMRATWPLGGFAPTSAPNPGGTILQGCPGGLGVYASGHGATTTLGYAIVAICVDLIQRI